MSVYPEYIALKNPITQEIWVGQKCQTVFSIGNSISKSDVSAVNSMFIKLAEMFVSSDTATQLCICLVMERNAEHIHKLLNLKQVCLQFQHVLQSTHFLSRCLALRCIATLSPLLVDNTDIHHMLWARLKESSGVEMLVSLSAVESLVKVSKPYATHFIRQTSLLEHFIGTDINSNLQYKMLHILSLLRWNRSIIEESQRLILQCATQQDDDATLQKICMRCLVKLGFQSNNQFKIQSKFLLEKTNHKQTSVRVFALESLLHLFSAYEVNLPNWIWLDLNSVLLSHLSCEETSKKLLHVAFSLTIAHINDLVQETGSELLQFCSSLLYTIHTKRHSPDPSFLWYAAAILTLLDPFTLICKSSIEDLIQLRDSVEVQQEPVESSGELISKLLYEYSQFPSFHLYSRYCQVFSRRCCTFSLDQHSRILSLLLQPLQTFVYGSTKIIELLKSLLSSIADRILLFSPQESNCDQRPNHTEISIFAKDVATLFSKILILQPTTEIITCVLLGFLRMEAFYIHRFLDPERPLFPKSFDAFVLRIAQHLSGWQIFRISSLSLSASRPAIALELLTKIIQLSSLSSSRFWLDGLRILANTQLQLKKHYEDKCSRSVLYSTVQQLEIAESLIGSAMSSIITAKNPHSTLNFAEQEIMRCSGYFMSEYLNILKIFHLILHECSEQLSRIATLDELGAEDAQYFGLACAYSLPKAILCFTPLSKQCSSLISRISSLTQLCWFDPFSNRALMILQKPIEKIRNLLDQLLKQVHHFPGGAEEMHTSQMQEYDIFIQDMAVIYREQKVAFDALLRSIFAQPPPVPPCLFRGLRISVSSTLSLHTHSMMAVKSLKSLDLHPPKFELLLPQKQVISIGMEWVCRWIKPLQPRESEKWIEIFSIINYQTESGDDKIDSPTSHEIRSKFRRLKPQQIRRPNELTWKQTLRLTLDASNTIAKTHIRFGLFACDTLGLLWKIPVSIQIIDSEQVSNVAPDSSNYAIIVQSLL